MLDRLEESGIVRCRAPSSRRGRRNFRPSAPSNQNRIDGTTRPRAVIPLSGRISVGLPGTNVSHFEERPGLFFLEAAPRSRRPPTRGQSGRRGRSDARPQKRSTACGAAQLGRDRFRKPRGLARSISVSLSDSPRQHPDGDRRPNDRVLPRGCAVHTIDPASRSRGAGDQTSIPAS